MFSLLSLLLTCAAILVTAIGFQLATGISGLIAIPIVIVLGFLPFGTIIRWVLLAVGGWYLYTHNVTLDQVLGMFHLS
jgi:hypothetical protein